MFYRLVYFSMYRLLYCRHVGFLQIRQTTFPATWSTSKRSHHGYTLLYCEYVLKFLKDTLSQYHIYSNTPLGDAPDYRRSNIRCRSLALNWNPWTKAIFLICLKHKINIKVSWSVYKICWIRICSSLYFTLCYYYYYYIWTPLDLKALKLFRDINNF